MSWIDKVKTKLIIKTGDGKTFNPFWINASHVLDYNVAEFEFPEIAGALVDRKEPKARKFNIEIHFQGENHLEEAKDFELSSRDKRAWTITHPYYGQIIVHPTSFTIEQSQYNVTTFTGTVIETLLQDFPQATTDPLDKIAADKVAMDATFADSYELSWRASVPDQNKWLANIDLMYEEGVKEVTTDEDSTAYQNLYNAALAAVRQSSDDITTAISKSQDFMNGPTNFLIVVDSRVDLFKRQLDQLNIDSLTTRQQKKIYENNASMLISSMAVAASTGVYLNRNHAIQIIDKLYLAYNAFVVNLDALQSANNATPTSYIPDAASMMALNDLVNFTIANLFAIALNAKQERIVYLDSDSNIILLTHQFYGLDPDDANIDAFIKNNEIGNNEYLQIRKGRKITFYV